MAGRSTPLPPIASPTPTIEEKVETVRLETSEPPEKLEDALPEIKRRVRRLEKDMKLKSPTCKMDCAYIQSSCYKWGFHTNTSEKFCKKLVDMQFIELYKRVWKTNFNESTFVDSGLYLMEVVVQEIMWNISDKSNDVRHRILQVDVHKDLLGYLKTDVLSPSNINRDKKRSLVAEGMLGILHNVIEHIPDARESYRQCGALATMQLLRGCESIRISTIALMIQAFLVTEDENEKLNSNLQTFQFLVNLLKDSILKQGGISSPFAVIEILEALNKLAVNDRNKKRIVDAGALQYYVQCLAEEFGIEVQTAAADGLWVLSFKCRPAIIKENGSIDALKRLLQHENKEVRAKAEGAIWILEKKGKDPGHSMVDAKLALSEERYENGKEKKKGKKKIENSENSKFQRFGGTSVTTASSSDEGHVFISYQWDVKPTVRIVCNKLKEAGFKVWIDEDNMSGSVLDAMAHAIENASVVIICLSQRYKESTSCRTEAEYTFRLQKRIVPLRLQPKYRPDGWLGVMIGSKLVYDVSSESKVEESLRNLVKELQSPFKVDEVITPMLQQSSPSNSSHQAATSVTSELSTLSPIMSWTKEDVAAWVVENELNHLENWFDGISGPMLMEYMKLSQTAPEAMLTYYTKNNLKLPDILAINRALTELKNSS